MSWRLLTFSLLIFAAIATTIGLKMGDELVKHVPEKANLPNDAVLDVEPQINEHGEAVAAEPPQPLLNGSLGVPQPFKAPDWKVKYEERKIVTSNAAALSPSNGQVMIGNTDASSQTFTALRDSPAPAAPPAASTAQGGTWVAQFNEKMRQCRTMGFNDRPVCIRNTREQFCGAHNAWGQVADCTR